MLANKPQATFEVKKLAIDAINRDEHRIDIAEYNGVMPSTIHKWKTKYKESECDINSLKRKKEVEEIKNLPAKKLFGLQI